MLWLIENNNIVETLFFDYQVKFKKKNGDLLSEKELITWTKKIGLKKKDPTKEEIVNFLLDKQL